MRWQLWLLALVLTVRAAVPTGWMPTAAQDGIRVMLCTGAGPATLLLNTGSESRDEAPSPQAAGDPCPFALTLDKAFAQPAAIALADHVPLAAMAAYGGLATTLALARLTLRPPARGPPPPA